MRMCAAEQPSSRFLVPAWLAWCAFIAYGSLLPFVFRAPPPEGALSAFMHMPWLQIGLGGRLDWLANLLLYIPAGFLGTLALSGEWPSNADRRPGPRFLAAAVAALLLGVVLALVIEFAQIYISPRTVSQNDVAAEAAGALLGCVGALGFGKFVVGLLAHTAAGGAAGRSAWLRIYLLAYLALSFFPFDLSTADAVFELKLRSGHAGWLWAPYQHARPATAALKLGLEAALTAPFGLALAARSRPTSWQRAALWGFALGAAIEFVQLFLLSATSQGASAASRAVGMAGGAWLAPRMATVSPLLTTGRLRIAAGLLALPWLAIVAYLAGWGRTGFAPTGWAEQAQAVRFFPFYYHYFAGEAQALTSVLQGVASYSFIGVAMALGWPRRRAIHAAWAAALVAACIETSKLLLSGQHPDPTNVLVASASAAAAWALTGTLRRQALAHGPALALVPTPTPPLVPIPPRSETAAHPTEHVAVWAMAAAAIVVAAAQQAPTHAWAWLVAVGAYAACIWRYPPSALLLVPVTIALTDTAAYSGHRWFELLDFIMLATLVVAAVRPAMCKPERDALASPRWLVIVCGLLLVPGLLTGLRGVSWPDINALLSPLSPWNAVLLAKGPAMAFVLAWFVRRHRIDGGVGSLYFGRGMVLALAGVVFLTAKERLAFVGPFDFSSDYRAPGPFTAIALGGAYIECFLAAAAPFAVVGAFRERALIARWCCVLVVLGAAYATMVTYSRAGQFVFLAVTAAAVLALVLRSAPPGTAGSGRTRWIIGVGITAAVAFIAASVLGSSYATARFKQLDSDKLVRLNHWKQGLDYGRDDLSTRLFGNGLGSFGRESYVQGPAAGRPGLFQLHEEAGNLFVRAHGGSLSYLDQRVDVRHGEPLRVSARLRTRQGAGLQALLCEKDLIQSRSCGIANLRAPADGQWHRVDVPVSLPVNPNAGWPARPIRFTLFLGGRDDVVDIDDIALLDREGHALLHNGDFTNTSSHWLYSSDMHLVWHMKNLWLQVYLEQGLSGVVAHAALLLAGLAGAWRAARSGRTWFVAFALALLAFQGVGLIDSVIDSARFSQLYLSIAVLAWGFGFERRIAVSTPRSPLLGSGSGIGS